MRMDQRAKVSAADLVNVPLREAELAETLYHYGEERWSQAHCESHR